MAMSQRWKIRPEGSTWGDFGPDDQLGRLNLVTQRKVLEGIAEVREGKTFCLSLPLTYPGGTALNPNRQPPKLTPLDRKGWPMINFPAALEDPRHTDLISDDKIEINMQYSTQWDGLAHVGQLFDVDGDGKPERVYYNGFRAGQDIVGPYDFARETEVTDPHGFGARKLGVENMAEHGMQGRGVLVDFERHFARDHVPVGYDDLMRILAADDVVIEEGDFLCMHTGFSDMLLEMGGDPDPAIIHDACAALDGRDAKLQNWITDSGVVALVADNLACEFLPTRADEQVECCSKLPLHEHCLFRLGVNLGELWHLGDLARWLNANGRNRFMLTAPPLRFPGAIASALTPVATV